MLTLDPAQRVERALAAASAKVHAGAFDAAQQLLAVAEDGPLNDFQRARADLIRAQLAFVTGRGSDAPPLLLKAAERLEPIDAALSRTTYLHALQAAIFAGRLAVGGGVVDVARAATDVAATVDSDPLGPSSRRVRRELHRRLCGGPTDLAPRCQRRPPRPVTRKSSTFCGWPVSPPYTSGMTRAGMQLSRRHVELARSAGALAELPLALSSRAVMLTFAGELAAAGALHQELKTVTEATGDSLATDPAMSLAAFCGNQVEASALIEATTRDVMRRGEGIWLSVAEWAEAVLNNGIGNYQAAMAPARRAAEHPTLPCRPGPRSSSSKPPRAVALSDIAAEAVARLCEMTSASGTDWALGIEARSRALISDGAEAERLFREAIERLGRTRMRAELARAHLLYGEWLRRERRSHGRSGRSCASPTTCSTRWAWRRSPSGPPRATGHRGDRPQSPRAAPTTADAAGRTVARLAARGSDQPRDRRAPLHQRQDGPVPPEQGVHQARHQLTQPAPYSISLASLCHA